MTHSAHPTDTGPAHGLLRGVLLLLLIAYPVTLHFGVLKNGNLQPAVIILLGLILFSGVSMVANRNLTGWLLLICGSTLAVWLFTQEIDPALVLKLPPILISLSLMVLFSSTLLPGRRALISRIAEMMHGHKLDPVAERYTRGVTILWSTLFVLMLLESILLALYASPKTWSLFTNFINYALIGLVFVIEYRIRVRKLSHLQHMAFSDFILSLRRIEWRRLW